MATNNRIRKPATTLELGARAVEGDWLTEDGFAATVSDTGLIATREKGGKINIAVRCKYEGEQYTLSPSEVALLRAFLL